MLWADAMELGYLGYPACSLIIIHLQPYHPRFSLQAKEGQCMIYVYKMGI